MLQRICLPLDDLYHTVLTQMKADQFRVFDKRYSLSTFRKMAILAKHMVG